MDHITDLFESALTMKRQGDFKESINHYLQLIDIDSTDRRIYPGLGKSAYLDENVVLSINAYACAMHLEMYELTKEMNEGRIPFEFLQSFEQLPDDIKAALPHKAGILIFQNPNLANHIAHALIDLDPNKPAELNRFVDVYQASIQGGSQLDNQLAKHQLSTEEVTNMNQGFYIPKGQKFFLEYIEWDDLHTNDVLHIYFDQERMERIFGRA